MVIWFGNMFLPHLLFTYYGLASFVQICGSVMILLFLDWYQLKMEALHVCVLYCWLVTKLLVKVLAANYNFYDPVITT